MELALLLSILSIAGPVLGLQNSSCADDSSYAHPVNGICTDYQFEETVTWNKLIWGLPEPKDNFDIAAIKLQTGELEGSTEFHPISGTEENVTSTYRLFGTFCEPSKKKDGKEKTVLLASHGGIYDSRYWTSTYKPEEYNFAQHVLEAGYSIFYYDRIGTGRSQIVSGYEAQADNQAELIAKIATGIRNGNYSSAIQADKIVLVGHSIGSVFTSLAIQKYPSIAEATVLTGDSFPNATDPSKYVRPLGATLIGVKLASTLDPPFARDSGYLGTGDIYTHAQSFFHPPYDVPTIEFAQSISQPASLLELIAAGTVLPDVPDYKGSLFLTTGEWDVALCGGKCDQRYKYGTQDSVFKNAKKVDTYLHPGAGHGVNFARNASGFYGEIVGFLDKWA